MWKAPVNAREALPYIVNAARRDGYLGLMVILARTAEARTLHEELSRDWTSIHDVTGHRIAVLCPDPHFVDDPEEEPYYTAVETPTSRFWTNLTLDDCVDFKHTRVLIPDGAWRGVPVPRPPYPEDVQQAAWTEAVSRCAEFFGIGESRLPAVLVVCFQERTDVLIQLRPATSLYKLCKRIASHPGYSPEYDFRLRERARLTRLVERFPRYGLGRHEWRKADDPPTSMARLLDVDAVRKQIDGLRHHMTLVEHVDPEAHRAWSESLAELIRTDAAEQTAQARLSEIARAVREHPRKADWRRLDQKVRKVQRALRKAADPPAELHYVPESQDERAEREARLAALQAELTQTERWLDSRPGLAKACRKAAQDELAPCAVESLKRSEYISLRRGYSAERIQVVRPTGPPPASKGSDMPTGAGVTAGTDNDLSGTVHGPAVQAGHMGDVHVHVHRPRRPSGTDGLAWLHRIWARRGRRD
ncbi:coiled-coil domain-containing protein [Streptomyces jeddahensis]|uniref:Uncharacterized protein n=1 Tax=Streptomyces jeddahensis TaxID=1716141 RepID=A0A177HVN4_9ACTN|nr:hypothetical protein [Streptomyces jeddahensis]OAH14637.1 hypothetical protein STSP_21480 [Streptomyces jeddahensis]